jgi:predicted amidohydrolase YtcJ
MPSATSAAASRPPLTLFAARRIHTMDESLPEATWVAVSEGRIVAVGSREDMAPWCTGREVTVNESLQSKVLLPGLVDNHIHPFLGAIHVAHGIDRARTLAHAQRRPGAGGTHPAGLSGAVDGTH